MFGRVHRFLLATSALVPLGFGPAHANPLGAQVVGGSASVQGQGTASVTVTQSTDKAIINWNTFNIGAGEKTQFIQPSSSSVALNRVTGGLGPSQIYGSLKANGQIFVVNPDGILIGPGAKIDTAGFLATTHDIANADFMAGRYNFSIPGVPSASIVNQGTITAQSGGFAALVAPGVRNTGTITARLGKIALASGNGFTLDLYGDKLITLGVNDSIAATVKDVSTGQSLNSLISNEGKLNANGGIIQLTAVAARKIVDSVINTKGVIEANTIGTHNGMIVLGAATAKHKPADAPTQTVAVSGTISAAGKRKSQTGGIVQVTGEDIVLASAAVDASGRAGGGTVLIGGDTGGGNPGPAAAGIAKAKLESSPISTASTVSIDAATSIDVSAKVTGDGGKAVVWSDHATVFDGTTKAQGGASSGNGGFVETSSHGNLKFTGNVDVGSPHGKSGTLLLDPQDVTIGSSGDWVITPTAVQTALASGDVLILTDMAYSGNGDITVAQNLSWNSAHELILGAYRNIIVNDGVTVANTGGGSLDLGTGVTSPNSGPWSGTGTGTVIFNGSGKIDFSHSTGYVSFAYNPVGGYVNPTDFNSHVATNSAVAGQFNSYMWVNNVNDLQNISQNLTGNYALANDINASVTAGWNGGAGFTPLGDATTPFTGTLVGFGGTVPFISVGAKIDHLTVNSTAASVGLFGTIGSTGIVSNVGLTSVSVTGGLFTGGLAGWNDGTIYQSYATGSVTGGPVGATGGLVGINGELGGSNAVLQSYSSATVNHVLLGPVPGSTGGLVGQNNALISQSYATGSATEMFIGPPVVFSRSVGGLVGHNNGVLSETYAAGAVTAVNTDSGGLVAGNGAIAGTLGATSIVNSYWDKQATGQASDGAAVGTGTFSSTGLTTAQLKASLPAGFSPGTWTLSSSANNGYPSLRWQTASATGATVLQPVNGNATPPTGDPPSNDTTPNVPSSLSQFFNLYPNLTIPIVTTVANSTPLVLPTFPGPTTPTDGGVTTSPLSSTNTRQATVPGNDITGSVPPYGQDAPISSASITALRDLFKDAPSALKSAETLESIVQVILKLHTYEQLGSLIATLQDQGLPVPQSTMVKYTNAGDVITIAAAHQILDGLINAALDQAQKNGHPFPLGSSVAHSLGDTVFNSATLLVDPKVAVGDQIKDQTFLVVNEVAGTIADYSRLVTIFEEAGRKNLDYVRSQGANDQKTQALFASSISVNENIAKELLNGILIVRPQNEAAIKLQIIDKILIGAVAQLNGHADAAQVALSAAKELAAQADNSAPVSALTAATGSHDFQDFAAKIAADYRVSGW